MKEGDIHRLRIGIPLKKGDNDHHLHLEDLLVLIVKKDNHLHLRLGSVLGREEEEEEEEGGAVQPHPVIPGKEEGVLQPHLVILGNGGDDSLHLHLLSILEKKESDLHLVRKREITPDSSKVKSKESRKEEKRIKKESKHKRRAEREESKRDRKEREERSRCTRRPESPLEQKSQAVRYLKPMILQLRRPIS